LSESGRSWLVIATCLALAIAGYLFFLKPYMRDASKIDEVLNARSTWEVSMQAYLLHGPIASETYRISNNNGAVKFFFSATDRDGTLTKQFDVPLSGPSGTFLFEQLRADGIWELDDKAMLPEPREEYVVEVAQTLGNEGGSRAFGFSDPHYWATTKSEEFQLRMPAKSMKKLNVSRVGSSGRTLRDPRYLKVVSEIKGFGPQSVLQAEELIRSELSAPRKRPPATPKSSSGGE